MLTWIEALLAATGDGSETGQEGVDIPDAPTRVRRRKPSGDARLGDPGEAGSTMPILALRPTGDGMALAHAVARVLVRRALVQEIAIDVVGDCAPSTEKR